MEVGARRSELWKSNVQRLTLNAERSTERRWLALIFSLYLILAVGYSLLMPIWEAPDEPAHYHLAWHLARTGRYPTPRHNAEAIQPRPYYYMAAGMIRTLDKLDPKLSDYFLPQETPQNIRVRARRFDWTDGNYRFLLGVYLLRWINILIGAAALGLNGLALLRIAPGQPAVRLGALALAALTPQYLHIMSSVNNDALGTLAGALLFFLAMRIAVGGPEWHTWIAALAATLLPLTTKLTALPVGAALLVMLIWLKVAQRKINRSWLIMIVLLPVALAVFYWLSPAAARLAWNEITWRSLSLKENALSPAYLRFILNQIIYTYWGDVGWLAVALPAWVIYSLTILGLIGAGTAARALVRAGKDHPQFKFWLAAWLVAALSLAAVIRNGLTTNASQGRFLFPAIGALTLIMAAGWHELLPARLQPRLPLIIVIVMLGCNLLLWITGIIPVYYQPFLD